MVRVSLRSLAVHLGAMGLLVLACGCEAKLGGSCDWRPQGGDRCFEYTTAEMESAKSGCTAGRVWAEGKPCDKTGSIGGCVTTEGTKKWLYPSAAIKTRDDAKVECTTWLDAR